MVVVVVDFVVVVFVAATTYVVVVTCVSELIVVIVSTVLSTFFTVLTVNIFTSIPGNFVNVTVYVIYWFLLLLVWVVFMVIGDTYDFKCL